MAGQKRVEDALCAGMTTREVRSDRDLGGDARKERYGFLCLSCTTRSA
jgi:hypothetical protein